MGVLAKTVSNAGKAMLSLSSRLSPGPVYDENGTLCYAVGATSVIGLLNSRPEIINRIFYRDDVTLERLHQEALDLAKEKGVPLVYAKGPVPRRHGWYYTVTAEFDRWEDTLQKGNHIVLVDPAQVRNVGAVIRSSLAFGIYDVAIVAHPIDTFSPRILRTSMSARLQIRVELFDTIEEYMERFPENRRYAFMLDAATELQLVEKEKPFSLIFGNESRGLPPEYATFCQPVFVEQANTLDSLNLSVAAAIGMYSFQRIKT